MSDHCCQECLELSYHSVSRNGEEKSKIIYKPAVTCQFGNSYVKERLGDINCSTIKKISLCSAQLTNLPENFGFCIVNLNSLDLSHNQLKSVPCSLKFLEKLKELYLNNNALHHVPPVLGEMTNLTVLRLSNNSITALPDSLANLQSLKIFILSFNKLQDLPECYQAMNTVEVLDLSGNGLKHIPQCIVNGMNNLETLNLSCNCNINLSSKPSSRKLTKLYARSASCDVKFPIWIFERNAQCLEVLELDDTSFHPFVIPDRCANLGIKILSLRNCHISDSFLENIISLTNELVVLRAGSLPSRANKNTFWEIRFDGLKNPGKVKEIDLRATRLPVICTNIQYFVNLVKLDVSSNSLNWLPDEICQLKKLEVFIVNDNMLSSLPDDIGQMISLKELRAERNCLARLPVSSRRLANLIYLDLYENEFQEIPEDLKCMAKLAGLDLDRNPIRIEDFRIRRTKYTKLRKNLRNRYRGAHCQRGTGPRYEKEIAEESYEDFDSSSIASSQWSAQPMKDESETIEENWEISDNSADEYDPTSDDGNSTRKVCPRFSYIAAISKSCLFCPANLHPLPIKQRIANLREKGLFRVHADTHVDGQFDDV